MNDFYESFKSIYFQIILVEWVSFIESNVQLGLSLMWFVRSIRAVIRWF